MLGTHGFLNTILMDVAPEPVSIVLRHLADGILTCTVALQDHLLKNS